MEAKNNFDLTPFFTIFHCLDLRVQCPAAAPLMFGAPGIGAQRLDQRFMPCREFAGAGAPPIPGLTALGRLDPFLDRVARQARASRNLAERQAVSKVQPPDLAHHVHGDHSWKPRCLNSQQVS